jgi:hypothetical protein
MNDLPNVQEMLDASAASIEAATYLVSAPRPTAALILKAYDDAGDAINQATQAYWRHIGRVFDRQRDSHVQVLREVARMHRRGSFTVPDIDDMATIVLARNQSIHMGQASSTSVEASKAAIQIASMYLAAIRKATGAR